MIYVVHHVVVLALAGAAALGLARTSCTHRFPRTAVLLWQAVTLAMLVAAVGALLSAGLAPYGLGAVPALSAFAADLARDAAALAAANLLAVAAGLMLAATAIGVQLRSSWRCRRQRARHRNLLQLVARQGPRAMVLDHPAAAAYYLPGRGACVVISSGALAALTPAELDAVLAHEQAHARERHHLVLAPFHALRAAVPCRLTAGAAERIELLIEMCADDRAARVHGVAPLVDALRRFQHVGPRVAPPGALAAADRGVQLRIRRLLELPPPRTGLTAAAGALATTAALVLLATPISLFVLPA